MNWNYVLLAAGQSSRMGVPKPLLTWNNQPLILEQVKTIDVLEPTNIIIVLGYHEARIRQRVDFSQVSSTVQLARNPDPDSEQTTSMKTALRIIGTKVPGMMDLVDQPPLEEDAYRGMIEEFQTTKPDVLIPTGSQARGHPPLFGSRGLTKITELSETKGIRAIYDDDLTVQERPVNSPRVHFDLDNPEDLRQARTKS